MIELLQQPNIVFKNDTYLPPQSFFASQATFKEICCRGMQTQHLENYVKAAVTTAEEAIEHRGYEMPTKTLTPFSHIYSPEIDITSELDADDTKLCQKWVGILRWAVDLGQLDIYLEVSLISSHVANHRRVHIKEILHISAY